ncbi:MAG: hypothetical protein QOC94_496, partial [Actinoplanes sp.]|nr:hypothetical protein [Actinoplanes sp.]
MSVADGRIVQALRAAVKDNERLSHEVAQLRGAREPIAIVAMSCRLPGEVNSPQELWDRVAAGQDLLSEYPGDRGWDDGNAEADMYARRGYFVPNLAEFDGSLFGITPREARTMDPQQRMLLEGVWEVFERAGMAPSSLRGSRTGVFVGCMGADYGTVLEGHAEEAGAYLITSTSSSVVSGRVAYAFGLHGPAVTVDTACSSSLVALHLASASLARGDCSLAVVGGVSALATPRLFAEFSRIGGLASDGRCKAFSDAADGTGWGEGCAVVLVERLSDARRLGHPVLAVIRGSAVNSDGASNGLTAPSGLAQEQVIRQALADAGLRSSDVDTVEAHGTGTALGDPIEAEALLATYGQGREPGLPLWLGSAKSNFGHTQATAGVVGVIKLVESMRHGELAATLHVDQPSSHVDWAAGDVRLLTERRPWPETGRPRRGAVSAFGMSGTNAHVVLESVPDEHAPAADGHDGAVPWVLSARTPEALRAQAARLRDHLTCETAAPADVARTLHAARTRFDHRAVVVTADRAEGVDLLTALAADQQHEAVVVGGTPATSDRVAFVFPGQGSQWAGMGRQLTAESPVFAAAMAECEEAFAPYVDWKLREVLDDRVALERDDVVQPALFAVMVSLARLWASLGVTPAAVVGHSQGEIAAAVVGGALSLADGARVVCERGKLLMETLKTDCGGLVSVPAPADRITTPGLTIAAVNSASVTVVAGDDEALAAVQAEHPRARRVPILYASHSPFVEPVRDEMIRRLTGLDPKQPTVPFYSTVTGDRIRSVDLDGDYWYRNLRQTVRYHDAVQAVVRAGITTFVEVSPHPVLAAVTDVGLVVETLRRGDGDLRRVLLSAAALHVSGVAVDWDPLLAGGRRIDLPTYAFQRQRHWLMPVGPATATGRTHALLGLAQEMAGTGDTTFTSTLSRRTHPWLVEHAVGGAVLVPGTALLDLVLRAGDEVGCGRVDELLLEQPLVVPDTGDVRLQVVVAAPEDGTGWRAASVYAHGPAGWVRHARATLADGPEAAPAPVLDAWPPADAEPVDLGGFYERL